MNTYMPSHANSSVNQVASAYKGNPQALEQRTQATNNMTPELIDLLAYQKLKSEKDNAAKQMALSVGKQPTVAQGMKDEAMNSAREEVTKSMGLPGLMQSAQGAPQPQGAQPQQPQQMAGLPSAQSNLPQQYQSGGIVAFDGRKGSVVPEGVNVSESGEYSAEPRTADEMGNVDTWAQLKKLAAWAGRNTERDPNTGEVVKKTAEAAPATTASAYTPFDEEYTPSTVLTAPRNKGLGSTQPAQARQAPPAKAPVRQAPATQAPAPDVPMDALKAKLLAGVNRDLDVDENVRGAASGKRYEDTVGTGNLARIKGQEQRTEGLRALQEKQAGQRPNSFWTALERMGENTRERGLGGAFKGVSKAVSEANAGYQAQDVKNMGTINALLDARDKALQENDIGKLKAIEGAIDDARAMHKAAQTTGASLITHDEAVKARMSIAETARKAAAALAGVNATERKDRLDATVARAEEQQAMNLAMKAATEIMKTPLGLTKYKDRSAEDLAAETYPKILAQLRGQAPAPANGDNKVFSAADAILNKGKK